MIEDIINNANSSVGYDKDAYIKKKREQLDQAYKTIDEAVEELKNSPEFFNQYLNVQSRFDMYTPRNALLIAKQLPTAMQLKERKDWVEAKITFKERYPKKIIIIEPREPYVNKEGKTITSYNAKELIDVSETNTKPSTKSYDKKMVLQALLLELKNSGIAIKAVDSLEDGKMCDWNKEENAIFIQKTDNFDLAIGAIAGELAKINLYENTNEIDNDKAECITYMICKKYGIDIPTESINKLAKKYSDMESQDIINDLTSMKDVVLDINSRMGQNLELNKREKSSKEQER